MTDFSRHSGRCASIAAATLFSMVTLSPGPQPAHAGPPDVRILMIGTSYSNGVKQILKKLYKADGVKARIFGKLRAKMRLQKHLSINGTVKKVGAEPWDWVILQEQSAGTAENLPTTKGPQQRYNDIRGFRDVIAAAGQGSQTMLMMTWADRGSPLSEYIVLREACGGVCGYVPIAQEIGARLAPVGWVFHNIIVQDPTFDLWDRDGRHSGKVGKYVAGLTVYLSLYPEKDPFSLWKPNYLDDATALVLRQQTQTTILTESAEWNIPL